MIIKHKSFFIQTQLCYFDNTYGPRILHSVPNDKGELYSKEDARLALAGELGRTSFRESGKVSDYGENYAIHSILDPIRYHIESKVLFFVTKADYGANERNLQFLVCFLFAAKRSRRKKRASSKSGPVSHLTQSAIDLNNVLNTMNPTRIAITIRCHPKASFPPTSFLVETLLKEGKRISRSTQLTLSHNECDVMDIVDNVIEKIKYLHIYSHGVISASIDHITPGYIWKSFPSFDYSPQDPPNPVPLLALPQFVPDRLGGSLRMPTVGSFDKSYSKGFSLFPSSYERRLPRSHSSFPPASASVPFVSALSMLSSASVALLISLLHACSFNVCVISSTADVDVAQSIVRLLRVCLAREKKGKVCIYNPEDDEDQHISVHHSQHISTKDPLVHSTKESWKHGGRSSFYPSPMVSLTPTSSSSSHSSGSPSSESSSTSSLSSTSSSLPPSESSLSSLSTTSHPIASSPIAGRGHHRHHSSSSSSSSFTAKPSFPRPLLPGMSLQNATFESLYMWSECVDGQVLSVKSGVGYGESGSTRKSSGHRDMKRVKKVPIAAPPPHTLSNPIVFSHICMCVFDEVGPECGIVEVARKGGKVLMQLGKPLSVAHSKRESHVRDGVRVSDVVRNFVPYKTKENNDFHHLHEKVRKRALFSPTSHVMLRKPFPYILSFVNTTLQSVTIRLKETLITHWTEQCVNKACVYTQFVKAEIERDIGRELPSTRLAEDDSLRRFESMYRCDDEEFGARVMLHVPMDKSRAGEFKRNVTKFLSTLGFSEKDKDGFYGLCQTVNSGFYGSLFECNRFDYYSASSLGSMDSLLLE
ncbi:hypothetical protein ADUPG1_006093 [Aduncisulcus paluster]|uniref:Uncharacterized protein n=1 Tax=Aduncisulcus paluster TaxID=2918883 RepID=A0ABQ5KIL4_9EUKA|nr:hypothetical protein ADUPG1_006093 [Aduncisulcus paluster]